MTRKKYIEWIEGDEKELLYHTKQYSNPKEYTKLLVDLSKKWEIIKPNDKIIDIGCGGGSSNKFFFKKIS